METTKDVRDRLREAGLRATRPRQLVYETLMEIGGHHSVDELVSLLRDRGHQVTRMSIYNVVADLQRAGLVLCADTGPGRALYEISETWHHHFGCAGRSRTFHASAARSRVWILRRRSTAEWKKRKSSFEAFVRLVRVMNEECPKTSIPKVSTGRE